MVDITEQRLRELEKSERKLLALEQGGVDNWEFYGESLGSFFKEEEIDELVIKFTELCCVVMAENVDEPAGHGCGYSITTRGMDEISGVLHSFIKELKELEK